jgi:hypothetical protein
MLWRHGKEKPPKGGFFVSACWRYMAGLVSDQLNAFFVEIGA